MNNYPLSCFVGAGKTTIGGVGSLFLGLIWGTIIVFSQDVYIDKWPWYFIGWIALIPYTIMRLWGLLILPFLGVMLYGVVWKEWNRLICTSLTAIILATLTLLSAKHNPFSASNTAIPFTITMGPSILIFFSGVAWEIKNKCVQLR